MADQGVWGILKLPDEILLLTLMHIPPSTTGLSLSRVSRRFYTLTISPELWKHYCQTTFAYWDNRHEFESNLSNKAFVGWKALFAARHTSSVTTSRALGAILRSEANRLDHIHTILTVGYDAKDVLLDAYERSEGQDYHLAQRYWSYVTLGCLNRQVAIKQWQQLDSLDEEAPNGTELSFAALDMFILGERRQGDINDIFARLDFYADSIRAEHPNIYTATPRERAITISQYLLDKDWVGISDDRNYHSLDHMFLGVSLFSTNHNSTPLVSAIIFCYVCRRLGLDAQPISYPFHVHALVKSPPGLDLHGQPLPADFINNSVEPSPLTHLYMDPFTSSEPVQITRLRHQLAFIAPESTQHQINMFLAPSTHRELTIRAAHNILASPSHYPDAPLFPISRQNASYAAWFLLATLASRTNSVNLHTHLLNLAQHFSEHFEQDIELFETHIFPLTEQLADADAFRIPIHQLRDSDRTVPLPKCRSHPPPSTLLQRKLSDASHHDDEFGTKIPATVRHGYNLGLRDGHHHNTNGNDNDTDSAWRDNSIVKYRVGQVFQHRRRSYLAVIYGWDPYCKMQETWIRMNGVDNLPMGRRQPFYHVLVEDGSLRYVAEENVKLLEQDEMREPMWQKFPIQIGKWFKRWDPERGVFVSNVATEYPDD
ncbi:hypothetical protein DV736_g945, partial [Chaetothyriales sp. CBS 134916]